MEIKYFILNRLFGFIVFIALAVICLFSPKTAIKCIYDNFENAEGHSL